jgi:ubiquinone/menaquinone biosynthesis C-methylase UbiE
MFNKTQNALAGGGVTQSQEEWSERNRVMSQTLSDLINRYAPRKHNRALDVGCQNGMVTDMVASQTSFQWWGIDPGLKEAKVTPQGASLAPGFGHEIPFEDHHFDCILFANVFEHVHPPQRVPTLAAMYRVLDVGGVLIGQLPNPHFFIESHSRLPFMGWLPFRLQKAYWKLSPMSKVWDHDFYVVTVHDMRREAEKLGFETVEIINFNYPMEVIPKDMRWAASMLMPIMKAFPWAWQFVFRKGS